MAGRGGNEQVDAIPPSADEKRRAAENRVNELVAEVDELERRLRAARKDERQARADLARYARDR